MSTIFISDLHLNPSRPQTIQLFLKFLQSIQDLDALYILGDFFEVWVGDDLIHPDYEPIIKMLHQTSNRFPIYWMHGNRDFLVGEAFLKMAGCRLLPDPFYFSLYRHPVLLTHGDQMCQQDVAYQRYRMIAQHPMTKRLFLNLPLSWRYSIATILRQRSQKKPLPQSVYEISTQAIVKLIQQYPNTQQIIHGHTHIPGIHTHLIQGRQIERIVLGEWHISHATIVRYLPTGEIRLDDFS